MIHLSHVSVSMEVALVEAEFHVQCERCLRPGEELMMAFPSPSETQAGLLSDTPLSACFPGATKDPSLENMCMTLNPQTLMLPGRGKSQKPGYDLPAGTQSGLHDIAIPGFEILGVRSSSSDVLPSLHRKRRSHGAFCIRVPVERSRTGPTPIMSGV